MNTSHLTKPSLTAADLRSLVRLKYPDSEYAVLFEVRDTAGLHARRSMDAMVVGYWPSRGCLIEGFEIKVSRSDWIRELKDGAKAQAFFSYCDRWWILVSDADIVRPDELPETWGLMCAQGTQLQVLKPAAKLTPQPPDNLFLAAILKRACGLSAQSVEHSLVRERMRQDIKTHVTKDLQFELSLTKERVADLEERIHKFKETSGVNIDSYSAGRIGEAVRDVMLGVHAKQATALRAMKTQVADLAAWLDANVPESNG